MPTSAGALLCVLGSGGLVCSLYSLSLLVVDKYRPPVPPARKEVSFFCISYFAFSLTLWDTPSFGGLASVLRARLCTGRAHPLWRRGTARRLSGSAVTLVVFCRRRFFLLSVSLLFPIRPCWLPSLAAHWLARLVERRRRRESATIQAPGHSSFPPSRGK
ncbi:hypothetical protein [Pandoravirus japonicus]|uniref:Uncharacterized protein n=1 Tax=Pandoravirus japonicus TaxID=2823154 RepID=A0A811BRG7_9VIRU|nr:hypothetical protein [Pandoravirus japonicus]